LTEIHHLDMSVSALFYSWIRADELGFKPYIGTLFVSWFITLVLSVTNLLWCCILKVEMFFFFFLAAKRKYRSD